MSDDLVKQSIAELQDLVRCRCHEAYKGRGLHDPDCHCDSAETVKVVADRIEELEAKLAKVVTELRKLGEAAKENAYGPYHIVCHGCSDTHHAVDAALTELTGGKP